MDAVHVDERGPCMLTWSGRIAHPFDLRQDEVAIEDIASSLSMINRFYGHTSYPYSVAQHSIIVSLLVPETIAWYGLMHDAPEAYVGDVISPIKRLLGPSFKDAEERAWKAICERFCHTNKMPDEVRRIDRLLRCNEQIALQHLPLDWRDGTRDSAIQHSGLPGWLRQMSPDDAKAWFLKRFAKLNNGEVFDG